MNKQTIVKKVAPKLFRRKKGEAEFDGAFHQEVFFHNLKAWFFNRWAKHVFEAGHREMG